MTTGAELQPSKRTDEFHIALERVALTGGLILAAIARR